MTDNEPRAVPVEGDRERLAALLHDLKDGECDHTMRQFHPSGRVPGYEDRCWYEAESLDRAGVSLTGSGLRERIERLAKEHDDCMSEECGLDSSDLRAALSGESGEPTP